jgi:hypothetical protein
MSLALASVLHIPEAIAKASCFEWMFEPGAAPPSTGLGIIELQHCFYPPGSPVEIPEWMKQCLLCRVYEGRGTSHIWAEYILGGARSVRCYVKPTTAGFIIVGLTRTSEPYLRKARGVYDELPGASVEMQVRYTCRAPISSTISGLDQKALGYIDPVFECIEKYPPRVGASPIARAIQNDIEDEFSETLENIRAFCVALTFVDVGHYWGRPEKCPEVDPGRVLGWFHGLCAIKSLPWSQETKERIAIWWSNRTTEGNYAGDAEVVRKLNRDIREKLGGVTYRSVFKFARLRGWDG